MSESEAIVDISTGNRSRSIPGDFASPGTSGATRTLDVRPFPPARAPDRAAWDEARQRLGMFASLTKGWNGGNAEPPSPHTIQFASVELAGLSRRVPIAPIINPSADGAIYAHWHRAGIDVELVFEAPYQAIVLIDDARGEIGQFDGDDPGLARTADALRLMVERESRNLQAG